MFLQYKMNYIVANDEEYTLRSQTLKEMFF
jgi:hypothetical protein